MSKKNKNKYPPQRSDTPPAQTAPANQTLEPSEEQNRSFISKIFSAVTEAGRTTTEEDRSVAAGLPRLHRRSPWISRRPGTTRIRPAASGRHSSNVPRTRRARPRPQQAEEERGKLEARRKELDARRKEIEEKKKEQERLARDEAARQKAKTGELEAERREQLARQKEMQDLEHQLLEREENAWAGFVAQQSSALAELRQRKVELEAELQALPTKLAEVHAGWVKDIEPLRQRLETEARQARGQLTTELGERRRQAEEELEQERHRAHAMLEARRAELTASETTLEQQRQKLRQERIQLRAEQELLEDGKQLMEKRVEQKAAARVESLQAALASTKSLLDDTRRDRNHLQAELRKAEEANRLFEQRSPWEVLEQRRNLEEHRRKLEQELAARPSEQEKQRLRQLDSEHEQRELDLARLRRENSELKARLGNHAIAVSELKTLKRQKEAAETYVPVRNSTEGEGFEDRRGSCSARSASGAAVVLGARASAGRAQEVSAECRRFHATGSNSSRRLLGWGCTRVRTSARYASGLTSLARQVATSE